MKPEGVNTFLSIKPSNNGSCPQSDFNCYSNSGVLIRRFTETEFARRRGHPLDLAASFVQSGRAHMHAHIHRVPAFRPFSLALLLSRLYQSVLCGVAPRCDATYCLRATFQYNRVGNVRAHETWGRNVSAYPWHTPNYVRTTNQALLKPHSAASQP